MRERVRCPLCPRAMAREDYQEHFDRFHAVNLITGQPCAYLPPTKAGAARREPRPREPEPDEQATLGME